MVFSSVIFLFLFLPAVLAGYFLIPKRCRRGRNLLLLIASLLFYCYGEPKGILIMLASIVVNYTAARWVAAPRAAAYRRTLLVLALAANLAIIGYFKYTGFLLETVNGLIGGAIAIPAIVMPIGISFFTFQGMSYLLDVYRGRVKAEANPINVAMYISLFPQLVAGPIVRYNSIDAEILERNEQADEIAAGLSRFVCGLAKKLLLANTFGGIAADLFALPADSLPALSAWIGAIAYTLQIYYDFSGYSDMAIGLGLIFGFHFPENFNYPYIAASITDFWRRWHMSLSGWFRDYVYIPLGGNRRGLPRQLANIAIVWALTGLWHGAAWNFVLWGLYFALILILEKLFLLKLLDRAWRPLRYLYSLLLIVVGWVIFNSPGIGQAAAYLGAMFSFGPVPPAAEQQALYLLLQYKVELALALALCMPVVPWLKQRYEKKRWYPPLHYAGCLLLFALSLLAVVNTSFNPFIYFRF